MELENKTRQNKISTSCGKSTKRSKHCPASSEGSLGEYVKMQISSDDLHGSTNFVRPKNISEIGCPVPEQLILINNGYSYTGEIPSESLDLRQCIWVVRQCTSEGCGIANERRAPLLQGGVGSFLLQAAAYLACCLELSLLFHERI